MLPARHGDDDEKRESWELRLDHGGRQLSFLPLRRRLTFSGLDLQR